MPVIRVRTNAFPLLQLVLVVVDDGGDGFDSLLVAWVTFPWLSFGVIDVVGFAHTWEIFRHHPERLLWGGHYQSRREDTFLNYLCWYSRQSWLRIQDLAMALMGGSKGVVLWRCMPRLPCCASSR
ncbi:unnamed protein product, partial [Ectocarpus sp. 13 AM-2016]